MNRRLSWIFLAVAVFLLVFGCQEYESTASQVSRALTGAPTDKTVWLLIGSLLSAITGILGFPNPDSKHRHAQKT